MTSFHELKYSDLYICLNGKDAAHFRYSSKNRTPGSDILVPPEYQPDIENIIKLLNEIDHNELSMVRYGETRLRAAFFTTANDKKWVALRKVGDKPPALDTLGIEAALVPHLRELGKRTGLILVCGATGQGKTTTCCSMLSGFLQDYGGVGFTIEDPVEYDMEGRIGKDGYCYQIEVKTEHEWADTLVKSLRCHPRYIFLGEVVTPEVANQLLRAATSGHLVIATVHAGSLPEGFEGLLQLAEQHIGDRARQLLASSITAIIYQNLTQYGLSLSSLIVDNATSGASIRNMIRENHIGQVMSMVEQQRSQIMQKGPAAPAGVPPKSKF